MFDLVKFHFDNTFYENPKNFLPFSIVQVGDIDTYSGFECKKHIQIADEITYIVNGNAEILCDNKTICCKSGDVIFNPKGTIHAINSSDGHSLRYYYLAFNITDKSCETERMLFDFFSKTNACYGESDRSLPQNFYDIFFNLYGKDEYSNVIVSDSIRRLLIYTVRSLKGETNNIYMPDVRFGKKRTVAQICTFIDKNIENISILKKLPQEFGYSYSYISSFFSKSMGISLKDYFLISRHTYACKLLNEGVSVTNVAERMGYSSIHVFSKAFSVREKMSPIAYIQKTKKERL